MAKPEGLCGKIVQSKNNLPYPQRGENIIRHKATTTKAPSIDKHKVGQVEKSPCIIFRHRRGSRHQIQKHKLPISDKNRETTRTCRERSPEERAVYFRGNRERERKGTERKYFSASPLVGSLLTFLPKQESKASRQGGTVIQSQQAYRNSTPRRY